MKLQRIHVVIVEDIFAQLGVIGAQHPLRGAGVDVALAVVAGVKQQRCVALDADIAQAQKQRAVRLAVALDAKQFAAGVGALDLRLEILVPAALAVPFGRGGKGRGGNQDEYKNGESAHGQRPGSSWMRKISSNRRKRHGVSRPPL